MHLIRHFSYINLIIGKILIDKFITLIKLGFKITKVQRRHIYLTIDDILNCLNHKSLLLLLENGGISDYLDMLFNISLLDSIKREKSSQDGEYYLEGCDYQDQARRIYSHFVTNIDYWDLSFNQKFAKCLWDQIAKFKSVHQDEWKNIGFIHWPILSCFVTYLIFYIKSNVFIFDAEMNKSNKEKAEYSKRLLSELFSQSELSLTDFISIWVKISSKSLGFIHEIKCHKWSGYGKQLLRLASYHKGETNLIFSSLFFRYSLIMYFI